MTDEQGSNEERVLHCEFLIDIGKNAPQQSAMPPGCATGLMEILAWIKARMLRCGMRIECDFVKARPLLH